MALVRVADDNARSEQPAGEVSALPPAPRPQLAEGESEGSVGLRALRQKASRRSLKSWWSSITRRVLTINLLALGILAGGLLYLDRFERGLTATELESLQTQGEFFAAALSEGAVIGPFDEDQTLAPELARQMVRRLVEPGRTRARIFDGDGKLLVDSRMLRGPGGAVQVEELPPLGESMGLSRLAFAIYDWVVALLPEREARRPYRESPVQTAGDYDEVQRALRGDAGGAVRQETGSGALVLSVAVPIQTYKEVLGAVMLSVGSGEIDRKVRAVRLQILQISGLALVVTVLLSLYLASTIARPMRRLAAAAEQVRRGHGRKTAIPDFTHRGDEIGELSGALRDMTASLLDRMDATERFAADVSHEIKNPLSSVSSAVETAARITDPVKQKRLLEIIRDDVRRLDRLISDISDASRLDSELSRIEPQPVQMGRMLETLADIQNVTHQPGQPPLLVRVPPAGHADHALAVAGVESRLVQVIRNLLSNAISFSPPDGTVRLTGAQAPGWIIVTVEDDGPGIPAGKLDTIFERFYSERPVGETFGTHSGLGLAISRQIVRAHGGSLEAENRESEEGRITGARFILRLPALGQQGGPLARHPA